MLPQCNMFLTDANRVIAVQLIYNAINHNIIPQYCSRAAFPGSTVLPFACGLPRRIQKPSSAPVHVRGRLIRDLGKPHEQGGGPCQGSQRQSKKDRSRAEILDHLDHLVVSWCDVI